LLDYITRMTYVRVTSLFLDVSLRI